MKGKSGSSEAEIDAILADYGLPAPVEWGKAGSYIQTTVRWKVVEERRKNDILFLPIGCTENHGLHLPTATDTPCQSDSGRRAPLYSQTGCAMFAIATPAEFWHPSLPPYGYVGHLYCA
ncbi:MAG: creatininase family protein [Anaerolineae bacterium]